MSVGHGISRSIVTVTETQLGSRGGASGCRATGRRFRTSFRVGRRVSRSDLSPFWLLTPRTVHGSVSMERWPSRGPAPGAAWAPPLLASYLTERGFWALTRGAESSSRTTVLCSDTCMSVKTTPVCQWKRQLCQWIATAMAVDLSRDCAREAFAIGCAEHEAALSALVEHIIGTFWRLDQFGSRRQGRDQRP